MRKRKTSVMQKLVFFIVAILIFCVAALAAFGIKINGKTYVRGVRDIRTGIDIRGGVSATFVPAEEGVSPTSEELNSARAIIEQRLDDQNILDRNVTVDTQNSAILVEFPWKSGETDFDPAAAIDELGETAELTFWEVEYDENEGTYVKTADEPVLRGQHVESSSAVYNSGQYSILLDLTDEGATLFSEATANNIGEIIAIYMDDTILTAATVQTQITEGQASISGSFTASEARELSEKINAGALPFSLKSTNYDTISATMGTGSLKIMIYAGIVAFIIISLYLLLYYRLLGFIADINLVLQISGQLLIFAMFNLTLTLPGIAGIILAIGMSVDSNIIISEGIKDELRNGKTLKGAIQSGYSRAFSAVMDCNITTGIVAVLLIIFGTGSMLSFGYTLLIGIVMNFGFGIICSKLMTTSLSSYKVFSNKWLYGYKNKAEKGGAA